MAVLGPFCLIITFADDITPACVKWNTSHMRTRRQKGKCSAPSGVNHTGSTPLEQNIFLSGPRSTCIPFHTCSLPSFSNFFLISGSFAYTSNNSACFANSSLYIFQKLVFSLPHPPNTECYPDLFHPSLNNGH